MQGCSLAARGWVRSLFFVLFSYASRAALKTDWKLVEEDVVGRTWDIVLVSKMRWLGAQWEGCIGPSLHVPVLNWRVTFAFIYFLTLHTFSPIPQNESKEALC
jgi:hypothetical protein